MFIESLAAYVPETRVDNKHFSAITGVAEDWFIERTGIQTRSKAKKNETTNSIGYSAVKKLLATSTIKTGNIDLIVGASYTPYDTVFSLAHSIQHELSLSNIPVVNVTTACSSLLNSFELVEGYFAMNKATTALIVAAEHNSSYAKEDDKVAGHLWGDGAVGFIVQKEKSNKSQYQIKKVITCGAATSGKANEGVLLHPQNGGVVMPNGRDVFINACHYMTYVTIDILNKTGLSIEDIDHFIPHQANLRISKNVVHQLQLPKNKLISNVEKYGNTGCASCGIAMAENIDRFKKDQNIVMSVFGGGYSYGASLIKTL